MTDKPSINFCFDMYPDRVFEGFRASGTWNGFDNVKVTPLCAGAIDAFFADLIKSGDADRIEAMPRGEDGLIDLSNGFSTRIVEALTWYECSAQLRPGDRVRFVAQHDIYPHCMVETGTLATVVENNLNEMHCWLMVLPDDRDVRHALAEWDGEVQLGLELDAGAEDPQTDAGWQSASPLIKL